MLDHFYYDKLSQHLLSSIFVNYEQNSTYEKLRRNLGQQQNTPEILGYFRKFWDSFLFLGLLRIFRRRGTPA